MVVVVEACLYSDRFLAVLPAGGEGGGVLSDRHRRSAAAVAAALLVEAGAVLLAEAGAVIRVAEEVVVARPHSTKPPNPTLLLRTCRGLFRVPAAQPSRGAREGTVTGQTGWEGEGRGKGKGRGRMCVEIMHGRSRMTIDHRINTMTGLLIPSGFYRLGRGGEVHSLSCMAVVV